jgi:hypothetical protein
VVIGLLHGFVTVNFSVVGSLLQRPTPKLEDQGLHYVWPLPFDLLAWEFTLPPAQLPSSLGRANILSTIRRSPRGRQFLLSFLILYPMLYSIHLSCKSYISEKELHGVTTRREFSS